PESLLVLQIIPKLYYTFYFCDPNNEAHEQLVDVNGQFVLLFLFLHRFVPLHSTPEIVETPTLLHRAIAVCNEPHTLTRSSPTHQWHHPLMETSHRSVE